MSVQIPDILNQLADRQCHHTIYFGPQGFRLVDNPDEFEGAQVGYAQADGEPGLVGWRSAWQVIGVDLELGDPYFVDAEQAPLPVFTAVPMEGAIESVPVANTLAQFMAALTLMAQRAPQAQAMYLPAASTLTDPAQLDALERALIDITGCAFFWADFMANYRDWLLDDPTELPESE